ncbi:MULTISPECIES: FprA family A-type flavoprotein [Anaerotignum]|uniref:Anaerobic nitric oxide reductase flavorubredoxin n=1 Tax=Anaerotignum neopropionicum TaxID=36847 RepID=A0A136WGR4_9FIRM|nr:MULTISPECIES: FprA family A-type flavoprotein [Anaerotignum]KXL53721.1 anaerobic nitric oxide reductase flavorubredoxin [Anaerotignum neopropionicum]
MHYSISEMCTVLGKVIQKPDRSFSFLAYLLRGEKNVLIDTVPEKAGEVFMAELKQLVPLSQLDAIILNHSEEDHSGALGLLLSDRADIPIYCTAACKHRLVSRYPNANFIEVANLSTLKIGTFEFRFTHTPGLHWDDNMVTYFENEQILFSNDLFGQYLGCEPPLDKDYTNDSVLQGAKTYFDKVFAQATPNEKRAVLGLADLNLKCIAPGHGVILTGKLDEVFALYETECAAY